jgi:hypothetical protein
VGICQSENFHIATIDFTVTFFFEHIGFFYFLSRLHDEISG